MTAPAKTISDLPHFRVLAVQQSEGEENWLELSGQFDHIAEVTEGRCSLLLLGNDVLIGLGGRLKSWEASLKTGSFETLDGPAPEVVVGTNLTYLKANWKPHHVWMVAEPRWKWERAQFRAMDATSKVVDGDGVSVVDGEEVTRCIEIRKVGKKDGLARFYPIFPSGRPTLPPIGPDGVIENGWNHAHCEICNDHITAGSDGYVDLAEHWVCEPCYDKYVIRHDLSFI